MIANFFRGLDQAGIEYLLISGQAAVLYGAATFSEDIDLWVNPTVTNFDRFRNILGRSGALYHKLTPPFTVEYGLRGHGFHFVWAAEPGQEMFLDVMGTPPRVGSFAGALPSSRAMETPWGLIKTIGIQPLVEIKKTQRLDDYPVISRLAGAWLIQPECKRTSADFRWVLDNTFTLPELRVLIEDYGTSFRELLTEAPTAVRDYGIQFLSIGETTEQSDEAVSVWMQGRIQELQQADRLYWRAVIAELKSLRAEGRLMDEGTPV